VVYHMGGGGGGSYSPPAGSCKIPGRFVIGTADFLYDLAKKQHDTMKQNGHGVEWVELPGVGHEFQKSTLPATWSWLQGKTLCGKTTPGSCGPEPTLDAGVPPPREADGGPPQQTDGGAPAAPSGDGGAAPPDLGAPPGSDGTLTLQRRRPDLLGGCSLSPNGGDPAGLCLLAGSLALFLVVLGAGRRR